MAPKVSILMAIYNGEQYLREAINSILEQTFTDFELLIIDDGSIDGSLAIIKSYDDHRIHLVHQETNQGLMITRNRGLEIAQGEYLATLDCDDISLPNRLETQVAFLEQHQDIAVCGSWVETIGQRSVIWFYPTDPDVIHARLLFESPIANSASMIRRRTIIQQNDYYYRYNQSEDYDLWARIAKHSRLANIPTILVQYRLHSNQSGNHSRIKQNEIAGNVRRMQLEWLGIQPTPEEFETHQLLGSWQFQPTYDFVARSGTWLYKLKIANQTAAIYPEPTFSQVLADRWASVCYTASGLGLHIWRIFWQSPLSKDAQFTLKRSVKLAMRCLTFDATHALQKRITSQ